MKRRGRVKWTDVPRDEADPLSVALAQRDAGTLDMVRDAIAQRQVALAFQPVMQAAQPGRVAFYEGLIRVFDPGGRVIPARDFMPALEASESGREVDVLALGIGLQTLAEQPHIRLSVNMSARSIGYPRWQEALQRGLARDATVAERLILEITESSAMLVPELVTQFMGDLARRGISFALDDFGAGFTSFRYLRDFQFDLLKIDGQFIRGVAQNPDNQVLTRALCMIAEQLDMFTIAESVERAEDAEWLVANGIDCLQGYFYAAPTIHPPWLTAEAAARVSA
ncbi:EAL domain-containing protein [Pseudooceanicola sp.]|uniref:EAL domain-containing protein n=1 Tax=Pseudooceanicola sp. TaxID=1914328 RepID=UPI002609478A|nr:EAL domain-containing protein [Pseudooceanicola sp.]MDF1857256.1 EAL domain-containing protein [Pseudooceanicola sp.]